jgi:hypothetical protein
VTVRASGENQGEVIGMRPDWIFDPHLVAPPKSKLPTKLLSELAHLFGVESAHAKTLPEADRLATISEELYRSASRHRR